MKKTLILAMLAIFGLSFVSSVYAGQVNEAGLNWYDNMDEAKAAAEKEKKLIYIYFTGGQGCGWCVKMKKETFADKDTQKKVLDDYVLAMLMVWDTKEKAAKAEDKKLMAKFGGRGVPFNVVLDQNLDLVGKFSGYKKPEDFKKAMEEINDNYKELKKLLKKVDKKSGRNYKNFYKLCKFYHDKIGDFDKAAELAEKLISNDEENKEGNNAELTFMLLEKASLAQDNDGVKKYMDKVKEIDSENKTGYYEKIIQIEMLTYINRKDWANAIKVYEEFDESKVEFHADQKQTTKWYVAVAYLNSNNRDKAKAILEEVIAIDKDNAIGKKAAEYLSKLTGSGSGF